VPRRAAVKSRAYLANLAVSWFQHVKIKVDHDEQIEVIIILG
jgi:hypothetical protein